MFFQNNKENLLRAFEEVAVLRKGESVTYQNYIISSVVKDINNMRYLNMVLKECLEDSIGVSIILRTIHFAMNMVQLCLVKIINITRKQRITIFSQRSG